ncbi:hypothetical protein [Cognatishimia sp. F0-27]|uniref:hypothetical protein n=1 Tax=Cognatishimia sp. F0-27 TaxID=2816855 RepID=UPI001D0BFDED|nr:hypothetical protein [Cognatishimia sp. F0-27]MCC1493175.1 hypothetical protein [Cognatishimia sp. F0-27]
MVLGSDVGRKVLTGLSVCAIAGVTTALEGAAAETGSPDAPPSLTVTEAFNGGRTSWGDGRGDVLIAWSLMQRDERILICGAIGSSDPAMVATADELLTIARIEDSSGTVLLDGLQGLANVGVAETLLGVDAPCLEVPGATPAGRYRIGLSPG